HARSLLPCFASRKGSRQSSEEGESYEIRLQGVAYRRTGIVSFSKANPAVFRDSFSDSKFSGSDSPVGQGADFRVHRNRLALKGRLEQWQCSANPKLQNRKRRTPSP